MTENRREVSLAQLLFLKVDEVDFKGIVLHKLQHRKSLPKVTLAEVPSPSAKCGSDAPKAAAIVTNIRITMSMRPPKKAIWIQI
jgi:hypothetical protein